MSDAAPIPVKKITANGLDFTNAATFRDLSRVLASDVQVVSRSGPRKLSPTKTVDVKHGDYLITIAPSERVHFAKDEFEKRYKLDPTDNKFYQSQATGKALGFDEPVILVGTDGSETPVGTDGMVFKSDIDQSVTPYSGEELTADFARLLKSGELVRLSGNYAMQYKAAYDAGDWHHIDDLNRRARIQRNEFIQTGKEDLKTVGALAVDAGSRLLRRLEKEDPELVRRGREFVDDATQKGRRLVGQARGFFNRFRGDGGPPKPGGPGG